MLPAAAPPRQRGPSPVGICGVFLGASPRGASPRRPRALTSTQGSEGCRGGWAKTGWRGLGVPQLCGGGEGRDEARSTGPCGAGGDLPGAAATTPGPLGARCGAAQGPQAAPHPPWGCRHPVPRLGWEIGKAFLVPSWASPPGLQPSALAHLGSGSSRGGGGEDLGLQQGLAGHRDPRQGRSQPRGTQRKHWRGAGGTG